MTDQKVLVVGGGFTGLSAAYRLSLAGCEVTLAEAGATLGGLAAGFEMCGVPLERAYHFLYRTDEHILALAEELGLADKLVFHESSVSTYYDGELYPMMTPLDLLRFKPLSFVNRIRAGVSTIMIQQVRNWDKLTHVTALDWLTKYAGQEVVDVIWEPLLKGKFDHYYDQVTMQWLWGRVKQRVETRNNRTNTEELGYFTGGFGIIVDALADGIRAAGGTIILNAPISDLRPTEGGVDVDVNGQTERFDRVLATVSSNVFSRFVVPETDAQTAYMQQVESIDYLDAAVLVFATDKEITPYYWHNINTPDSPFVVFLSLTALVGTEDYGGKHIYYIGDYIPRDHRYMSDDESTVKAHWYSELAKMFPSFSPTDVTDDSLFRFRDAQHIVDIGFEDKIPAHATPWDGVYLSNFSQIYPMDRGTNLAIEEGQKLAEQVLTEWR